MHSPRALRLNASFARRIRARIAAQLASILSQKALALDELERPEDALPAARQATELYQQLAQADPQTYDILLADARRISTRIAAALFKQAFKNGEKGRPEEALGVYDELITSFTDDPEPGFRRVVAAAA